MVLKEEQLSQNGSQREMLNLALLWEMLDLALLWPEADTALYFLKEED